MLVPREIMALEKISDREASRYALGGIQFERDASGKPFAVACDGRRLMVAAWHEAKHDEYPAINGINAAPRPGLKAIVPSDACKKAAKMAQVKGRMKGAKPILQNVVLAEQGSGGPDGQPNRVTFAATNLEQTDQFETLCLDGRFPKWQDVCPSRHAGNSISICIDPLLLAEMLQTLASIATDDCHRGVILTIDANKPAICPLTISAALPDGCKAYGVLMPLAADASNKSCEVASPAWCPNDDYVSRLRQQAATTAKPAAPSPAPQGEPVAEPTPIEEPVAEPEQVEAEEPVNDWRRASQLATSLCV